MSDSTNDYGTPDQTGENIAAVTGSGVGGRPGDKDVSAPVDSRVTGTGFETETARVIIPTPIIPPGPSDPRDRPSRGPRPF